MLLYSPQRRFGVLCTLLGSFLCWDIDELGMPRAERLGQYNHRITNTGDMVGGTGCVQLGKGQTCREMIITFKYKIYLNTAI